MRVIGFSGCPDSVQFKRQALPELPRIYDRIAQGFDAAAALVDDGRVLAAAAEERFNGEKSTNAFPRGAIRYCLQEAGVSLEDVDFVAHSFDFERYRASWLDSEFARQQFQAVYSSASMLRHLESTFPGVDVAAKFVRVEHHEAHAASAFYPSGFETALILVADGMGEVHSTSVYAGSGQGLERLAVVVSPHSLGILYSAFTLYLGFETGFDEYKVMGLAAYGDDRRYFDTVMSLVELKRDGSYAVPMLARVQDLRERESHASALRHLTTLFGPPRQPGAAIEQRHMDVAAALQSCLSASLLHLLAFHRSRTGLTNLCMAGGVALNCSANGVVARSRLFDEIFVQPAAGDDGSALGAALQVAATRGPRRPPRLRMSLPLWGPGFDGGRIEQALQARPDCRHERFESFDELAAAVAACLAEGEVVGWFQGRMEFGPRALGNRSILADPRDAQMRERINRMVKKREPFRPFAPAVLAEQATRYFEIEPGHEAVHACMLVVAYTRAAHAAALPAVTHVDGSARVQTVAREAHPRFWHLLKAFESLTGLPVLLNTSFNVRGQPIVCTPEQALATFVDCGIDLLVIDDFVVRRREPADGPPGVRLPGV